VPICGVHAHGFHERACKKFRDKLATQAQHTASQKDRIARRKEKASSSYADALKSAPASPKKLPRM